MNAKRMFQKEMVKMHWIRKGFDWSMCITKIGNNINDIIHRPTKQNSITKNYFVIKYYATLPLESPNNEQHNKICVFFTSDSSFKIKILINIIQL